MKTTQIIVSIFVLSLLPTPLNAEKHPITLSIENIQHKSGTLYIANYKTEETWLKEEAQGWKVPVTQSPTQSVTLQLVSGPQALAIYQDLNNNQRLDVALFGLPKEPTAMSNNAIGFLGPPSFEDSQIEVSSKNTQFQIRLKKI